MTDRQALIHVYSTCIQQSKAHWLKKRKKLTKKQNHIDITIFLMNWKKIYPWKQHFYLIQISILVIISSSESSKKKKSHIFLHITITECVTWKSMDTSTVNTLKCFMHNIQLHLCTQKIQLRNGLTVYGRTSHFLEHADFCGKIQISFLFGVLSPPAG